MEDQDPRISEREGECCTGMLDTGIHTPGCPEEMMADMRSDGYGPGIDATAPTLPPHWRKTYHVALLLHPEQFLQSTIQEMLQVRKSLWLTPEEKAKLRPMARKQLRASQGRFRDQIRGLVGALRLVRDARAGRL